MIYTRWLDLYLDCSRDRVALKAGLRVLDGQVDRDAEFRNRVFRRADSMGFPRCQYRPAEAVCEGIDAWGKFTAATDVHALADAMLELDGIGAGRFFVGQVSAA